MVTTIPATATMMITTITTIEDTLDTFGKSITRREKQAPPSGALVVHILRIWNGLTLFLTEDEGEANLWKVSPVKACKAKWEKQAHE